MDDESHAPPSSGTISLVPRSVAKRKNRSPANNVRDTTPRELPKAFELVNTDDARSCDSRPASPSSKLSQAALGLLVSLLTVHLTECLISDGFKLKLRTPQGYTSINLLLQQLQDVASYTTASVATALSTYPDLYRVRLATARLLPAAQPTRWAVQPDQLNQHHDAQIRGGGYEMQFLDGQRRARISPEELEQNSIFVDNVPPQYATGKEGILRLLSEVAPTLVDPTIILGIGGIASTPAADTGGSAEGCLPMRHVVIVFNSKANAEIALRTISGEDADLHNGIVARLRKLGCVAKTIGELQDLRLEYLRYQAHVREILDQSVPDAEDQENDHVQSVHQRTRHEEVVTSTDRYPHHCLIFLRNLPDSTNKTEIKAKLDVYLDGDKVDYVDWKKGQITAYVRVLRPVHASKIIGGLNNEAKDDTMKAELLMDKQEEIYWMKLPEKIRAAALQVHQ